MLPIITRVETSEWATLIVMVKKANSTYRVCGDYNTTLNPQQQTNECKLRKP